MRKAFILRDGYLFYTIISFLVNALDILVNIIKISNQLSSKNYMASNSFIDPNLYHSITLNLSLVISDIIETTRMYWPG